MSPRCNLFDDIALLERKLKNAERFQVQFQKYRQHLQKLLRIAEQARKASLARANAGSRDPALNLHGSIGGTPKPKRVRSKARKPAIRGKA